MANVGTFADSPTSFFPLKITISHVPRSAFQEKKQRKRNSKTISKVAPKQTQ